MTRSEMLRGLRRFAALSGVTIAITLVGSVPFALVGHQSLRRAAAIALYLVGSFCVLIGFFHGSRPPVRADGEGAGGGMLGPLARGLVARWATPEERDDSWRTSALFVTLGLTVIGVGLLIDARDQLL
jgi:MFS family permease